MRCWGLVYSGLMPRAANEETERGGIPPGTGHRCAYRGGRVPRTKRLREGDGEAVLDRVGIGVL